MVALWKAPPPWHLTVTGFSSLPLGEKALVSLDARHRLPCAAHLALQAAHVGFLSYTPSQPTGPCSVDTPTQSFPAAVFCKGHASGVTFYGTRGPTK